MEFFNTWRLQTAVNNAAVEGALHVEDDVLVLQQGGNIEAFELLVSHGSHASVELLRWQLVHHLDAILMLHDGRIGPRVVNGDVEVVFLQGLVDVDHLGVAHIGAVLLEGETQDEDVAVEHLRTYIGTYGPYSGTL